MDNIQTMIHQFIAAEPKRQKKGVGSVVNGKVITSNTKNSAAAGVKKSSAAAGVNLLQNKTLLEKKLQRIDDLRDKTYLLVPKATNQGSTLQQIIETLDRYENLLNKNLRILNNANPNMLDKFDANINNKIDLDAIETQIVDIQKSVVKAGQTDLDSSSDDDDDNGGAAAMVGASKKPSSPSGASKKPSSSSGAQLSNIWEYRDNDKIYKAYGLYACKTINEQVQKGNFGNNAIPFRLNSGQHTFDVILINENEGKQSGQYNTRHIRRQGVLKQQSTTSVSPSASMSPSVSSPISYSGNAVQDFKTKPWTNSSNPNKLTRAEWFAATCLKNGILGVWEWSPPYEMTQNSPPDFTDDDKSKLGEDPIDLWEYRGLSAMDHRSNGLGRELEFIGFFRFTGNRCGKGPNDLVNRTLQNVKRLRNIYGDIKMNVLYHATNKITLANLILPSKFIGAFSSTAVYGKGTYFAMGPYIDYTFGNNIYKNPYASWGGNDVDGYAYIVVSHAVTRPSLRNSQAAMNNGFAGNDSRRYITGGSLGHEKSNPLPLANREIVYGDFYDRDDPDSGCPVDDLIFVVGVAVFKL